MSANVVLGSLRMNSLHIPKNHIFICFFRWLKSAEQLDKGVPIESLPLYRDMFWVRLFCRKESTDLEFNSILPKGRSSKNVKVSSYAGHPKTSVIYIFRNHKERMYENVGYLTNNTVNLITQ